MHREVLEALICPVCGRTPLALQGGSLVCPQGHRFDIARQGYVSLLARPLAVTGDSAAMVAAREAFLGAGHYRPVMDAIAAIAAEHRGLVVDAGAGPGLYLRRCVEAGGAGLRRGLAIDVSKAAARRAARVHPDVMAVVADAHQSLPIADAAAALVLVVFAPRQPAELRRITASHGELVVVTPLPDHLAELREHVELLAIDASKEQRLDQGLSPHFRRCDRQELRWTMELPANDIGHLVAMGPSAFHLSDHDLDAAVATMGSGLAVTAAMRIDRYRRS